MKHKHKLVSNKKNLPIHNKTMPKTLCLMNQSQEKQSKNINMKYFWGHFSAINLFLLDKFRGCECKGYSTYTQEMSLYDGKWLARLDFISF